MRALLQVIDGKVELRNHEEKVMNKFRQGQCIKIPFEELEQHRIVGTGQFGLVRLVRHMKTNNVYALKVLHKGPMQESKQIEHVMNERKILEEADHVFCVGMVQAYQDKSSLYLLQVGGLTA